MPKARKAKPTDKAAPFYEQVANVVRNKIVSLEDSTPVRMPTEHQLCKIHNVSRITIRKALETLEREGLIQRTPGRGTLTVPAAISKWKALRRSKLIHVLSIWEESSHQPMSFYGQVHQGMFAAGEEMGYRLALHHLVEAAPRITPTFNAPDASETLGVIMVGAMAEEVVQQYTHRGYPVICVDYWTYNTAADVVVVDCFGEGQMATEFLARQGHKELFFLGNIIGHGQRRHREADAVQMLAGVQRALALMRMPQLRPNRIRFCRINPQEVSQALQWFVKMRPRPTAGIIFSDIAMGYLQRGLQKFGLRCPSDVSLICKTYEGSDMDAACLISPPVFVGNLAVESLIERAAGKRVVPLRIAVPSRLEGGPTVRSLL